MTTFKELFEGLNLKDEQAVEKWIEDYIEQNYSEDQLSTENAWKVHAEVAKGIKSKKIRSTGDIEDVISRAVNNN